MLRLSDNPPISHPAVPVSQMPGRWSVAHTKARFEKSFARDLQRADIAYFLPMVERVTFSGGRRRRGPVPLFPGYVFFAGDEGARLTALATHRLCQVIPAADQAALVAELSALQRAIETKASLDPYPYAVVGRRCRIATGPFEGIEGVVVCRDGVTRLVLQVSLLGQSVAMEAEPGMVEPAG